MYKFLVSTSPLLSLLLVFCQISCKSIVEEKSSQNVDPMHTNQRSHQAHNDQDSKTYYSTGEVISVNKTQSSIQLKHDEIKGFMPAMSMDFYVKDPSLLNDMKPGERVKFDLESGKNGMFITKINKQ
jgi:Cu(I)/Ag(I) efflux system periplasmic protein CusF